MHNPDSVPEIETHKILWDFEIQTDHLIPARRPDLVLIKKKRMSSRGFFCSSRLLSENKKKRKN